MNLWEMIGKRILESNRIEIAMYQGFCQYFFIRDFAHFSNVLTFDLTQWLNLLSDADSEEYDLGSGNWQAGRPRVG